MRKSVSVVLISTLALSGCATKANPFNWFGGGGSAPVTTPTENTNPLIPEAKLRFGGKKGEDVYYGQPLASVSSLVVERIPGGAILRVTGLAARQGVYSVQLTPANEDEAAVDGVLTYRLEGLQGPSAGGGTPASREVVAAHNVTDQTLQGVRTIRVEAQNNALQSRR